MDRFELTYGAVRRMLVALPTLLFVASLLMAVQSRGLESSISAYYGGPLRDLFVGVLIATAVCLLAYRGESLVERYNLQGAAVYLLVVALVPTGLGQILDDLRTNFVLSPDGVSPDEYVWALRISVTLVVALCALVFWRRFRSGALRAGDGWARAFIVVTLGVLAAFLVFMLWQLWVPSVGEVRLGGVELLGRQFTIHDIAAILFVCALVVAVWSHGWPHASARREGSLASHDEVRVQARYRWIAAAMVLGPVGIWAASSLWLPGYFVLLVEWWEIAFFSAFWVLETRRLGTGQPAPGVRRSR
ncbi:MAG: hypothetical protein GX596_02040 [Propionibacterium sp.]|nr:hypothetical protein [Propionibacterium sp.]